VETTQENAAACPSCEVVSTSVKARVVTSPRDIGCRQDRIVVRWNKTRWRRREDYCGRSSFTEAIAQVPPRARTTQRLRTAIGAGIGDATRSVAQVTQAHEVSWPTAHRAFVATPKRCWSSRNPHRCSESTRPARPGIRACSGNAKAFALAGIPSKSCRQLLTRAQNAGVSIKPIVEVDSPAAALALAARGVGDTVITLPLAHALGWTKSLYWNSLEPPLYETFAFITRRDAHLSPATQVLIRLAKQRLVQLPHSSALPGSPH
jgi:hypothetical protein